MVDIAMREFSPIVMLINTCHLSKDREKKYVQESLPFDLLPR